MNKPTVTIEYCEECMYLQPALEAAHTILTRYADRVGAVILKPGHGGIFRVTADGAVIIEMGDEGLPTAERVAQALDQAPPGPFVFASHSAGKVYSPDEVRGEAWSDAAYSWGASSPTTTATTP
jgi:selenoprotein W-related protein